ncbi:MAG: hypothetical protein ACHQ52_13370 [Candidatus Eisenbacteria bacterium]
MALGRRALARRRLIPAAMALAELERHRTSFDLRLEPRKWDLLWHVWAGRLRGADELRRFHDLLCFMQAYVESGFLFALARRMLASFTARYARELRRHRDTLVNSGIAGTRIRFEFFSPTGRWLAALAPDALHVDWDAFERGDRLEALLPLLAHPAESPGLDEYAFTPREWVERMKGPRETDACFLARRFARLPMDDVARETLWDGLDLPMWLEPSPTTPSRTFARIPPRRMHHVTRALTRTRPDLAAEIERAPRSVRAVPPGEGLRYVDLAREAMVTRERDLDAFAYGDPRDVRLVEYEDGLVFACIGVVPERRLLLEAVYGYLTLKNGVPIGYVLTSALYGSSELAYNVFDTWRGVEAATVYARVLAMTRRLFGTDTFTIVPYQLGDGNDEAIESGAWWFYHKLGFEPRDPVVERVLAREKRRMTADPAHRSSPSALRRLAKQNLFFQPRGPREDVLGRLTLANVGLAVTTLLARRFGSDRAAALATCAREAGARLGTRAWRDWGEDERTAWERWAPVVLVLPGLERWSTAERRAAAEVIRLKGSRRESDFVLAFDAHRKLRGALARLTREADPDRVVTSRAAGRPVRR